MSAVRVPFAGVVPRDLRRAVLGFGSRVEKRHSRRVTAWTGTVLRLTLSAHDSKACLARSFAVVILPGVCDNMHHVMLMAA